MPREISVKRNLMIKDLEEIEVLLVEKCAERNYNTIKDEIGNIKVDEGGMNSGSLWRLKKKLSPKCKDPHTAMLELEGNLTLMSRAEGA